MLSRLFGKRQSDLPQWPPLGKLAGIDPDPERKKSLLASLFTMLSAVIATDGNGVRQYHEEVRDFMKSSLRLRTNEELYASSIFIRPHRADMEFQDAAKTFYQAVGANKNVMRCMVSTLVHFATLGSGYSDEKRKLIDSARHIFGLATGEFESLSSQTLGESKRQEEEQRQDEAASIEGRQKIRQLLKEGSATELERAYELFGIKPDASTDTVREIYRKLVTQYHPDRVAAQEKRPAKIEEARRRFQTILHAYRTIMKDRKEKGGEVVSPS